MRATKPFSKTKKPQTLEDSIIGLANIVLQKLAETKNTHAITLWLADMNRIELSHDRGYTSVLYYKRNLPPQARIEVTEHEFVYLLIENPSALFKMQQLAQDIKHNRNVMIAKRIK